MINEQKNTLAAINALIADDFIAVNQLIQAQLASDVVLINQLAGYLIHAGGKRLRPLITLLAARAAGYQGDAHITAATIVEFIHSATLLHDDVVDHSELRRGQQTANAIWGNEASVLVGDFLYTRSFQLMVSLNDLQIMSVLADATNRIAEGEVLQLLNCNDPETTEQRYLDVIYAKTAKLFEAAGCIAGVLAGQYAYELAEYGKFLGTAFQLVDDVLDYSSDSATLGKNIGDDLAEGKPTLPLIHAMQNGTLENKALIQNLITLGGGEDQLTAVLLAMQATDSLRYTADIAREQVQLAITALHHLPESAYKKALVDLAHFAIERVS